MQTLNKDIAIQPVWTVAANIVHERPVGSGGREIRIGTKHFRPGTKVYIIDWFAGMCERIVVVGAARKSGRVIKIIIRADWVENLRVKLCYDPVAIKKIYDHYGKYQTNLTKEYVTTMCKTIPYWQKELRKNTKHKVKHKVGFIDKLKSWFFR